MRRTRWRPGVTLTAWRDEFIAAGREGLKGRHGGEVGEEQRRLREAERRIGELTMENDIPSRPCRPPQSAAIVRTAASSPGDRVAGRREDSLVSVRSTQKYARGCHATPLSALWCLPGCYSANEEFSPKREDWPVISGFRRS